MEKFTLVEKKKSLLSKLLQGVFIILSVVTIMLALLGNPLFFLFACVFVFAFFMTKRCIEFEYSYFDGEVRFAKIINKSRRKKIGFYQMDETILIAPEGDRSIYNYENDSKTKVRNLTSGDPEAKVYAMVTKGEKGMELVRFEPDEEILGEICKKYAQKVKR